MAKRRRANSRKKNRETIAIVSTSLIIAVTAGIIFLIRNGFDKLIDGVLSAIIIGAIVGAILELSRRTGKLKISF